MTKKIIILDTCFDCPFMQTYGGKRAFCFELDIELAKKDKGKIPNICPLEDFIEES